MNVTYQTENTNRANILAISRQLAARNEKGMDKRMGWFSYVLVGVLVNLRATASVRKYITCILRAH